MALSGSLVTEVKKKSILGAGRWVWGKEGGGCAPKGAVKKDIVTKAPANVLRAMAFQVLAGVCLQLSPLTNVKWCWGKRRCPGGNLHFKPERESSGGARPQEPRGWLMAWSVQPRAHPGRKLGSLGWVSVSL